MSMQEGQQSPLTDDDVKIKVKGHARMFRNPVLEVLSLSSPMITTLSYGSVIAVIVYLNTFFGKVETLTQGLWIYGAGLLAWTFFEYVLHRYVFHYVYESEGGKRFHYLMHGYHHEYPRDSHRLFMPPLPGALIATVFLIFWFIFLWGYAFVFTGGFVNGYLFYTLMHYSIHRFKPPGPLKNLWKHHNLHHFKYNNKAFGVSSTLWDHVFRTLPPKKAE